MSKILVTGTAGFIGFHLVNLLIEKGFSVIGIDSLNDYYDINLKYGRLQHSGIKRERIKYGIAVDSDNEDYKFYKGNIEDRELLKAIFVSESPDYVINLAAQAGVRYSLENPYSYVNSNLLGFVTLLEIIKEYGRIKHFVYASSSSVYGLNKKYPFSENDCATHPASIYAATKRSNELIAHTYSHLFGIPVTGLRFFTVYGPWGRPDMALFLFTKAILNNQPIKVFNNGNMERDFTYVADIVKGVYKVMINPPMPDDSWDANRPIPSSSSAPFKIFNIGNGKPVKLMNFIEVIEKELGVEAKKEFLPMQPGDVEKTWADVSELKKQFDYQPTTTVEEGVKNFLEWYLDYYK